MKKWLCMLLCMAMTTSAAPVWAAGNTEEDKATEAAAGDETAFVKSITADCELAPYGYRVTSFVLTVDSTADLMNLKADDFQMNNCVMDQMAHEVRNIPAKQVSFTENQVLIEVEPFYLKISGGGYGDPFTMTCTNENLDFGYDEAMAGIKCDTVDTFDLLESTSGSTTVPYWLYSPETQDEALPLVIFNHGGMNDAGEVAAIDAAPFIVSFAEEESQKKLPCYVMASVRDSDVDTQETCAAIKGAIDGLVESGKVDPNRVYMTGESAGAMATMTFANQYPGYLAAIVLLNGGPFDVSLDNTLEEATAMDLNAPYSDAELETFANSGTSVMFVQSLGDILSVPIRFATVYNKLLNLGMKPGDNLVWHSYTAEQYNYLLGDGTVVLPDNESYTAVDNITGKTTYSSSTGKLHSSSCGASNDSFIKMWLVDQTLADPVEYVPYEVEGEDYTQIPEGYTKYQNYKATVVGSAVDVLCAMNDDETEFYLYFFTFNDDQVLKGKINEDGTVQVLYDLTGFMAGEAENALAGIDESAWQPVE